MTADSREERLDAARDRLATAIRDFRNQLAVCVDEDQKNRQERMAVAMIMEVAIMLRKEIELTRLIRWDDGVVAQLRDALPKEGRETMVALCECASEMLFTFAFPDFGHGSRPREWLGRLKTQRD